MKFVLLGEIGSGKDYVLNEIVKRYKIDKKITDTTRDIRDGEVNGKTYNFISREEFEKGLEEGRYIEHQKYSTKFGDWFYGLPKDNIMEDNCIVILDKEGFLEYKKYVPDCISICLYCIDETERFYKSIKRLKNCSMDSVDEVYRRIRADESKFKDIDKLVDFSIPQIYNENTIECVFSFLDRLGVEKREVEMVDNV